MVQKINEGIRGGRIPFSQSLNSTPLAEHLGLMGDMKFRPF